MDTAPQRVVRKTLTSQNEKTTWTEVYPPDFDHGGEPLLGSDASIWLDVLAGVALLGAECSSDGRVVVVAATVLDGFVEVVGQFVQQGEALTEGMAEAIRGADVKIPVDRHASRMLGLEVELDQVSIEFNWRAAAQRIELDLLSTIQRIANRKNHM